MRFVTLMLVVSVLGLEICAPSADAAYGGITTVANRRHDGAHFGRHATRSGLRCRSAAGDCEDSCYTVMKTMTRTVYERVTEQREMVVYDTVWEKQTVQEIKRVAEVQSRVEQFSYQRPVWETVTQQVPYTVQRPYVETRTCDVAFTSYARSYETRVRSVPHVVHHTVCETKMHTVYYRVPRKVHGTKTVQVPTGHWETRIVEYPRTVVADGKAGDVQGAQKTDACQKGDTIRISRRVWVSGFETREVPYTKTVYEIHSIEVPRKVKRVVPEVRTRDVQYTVCRLVPVTQTRTVSYRVVRSVPEHRMKTVSGVIEKQITEIGTRTVPYTTFREVPVSRSVTVPKQVPRTVICTVTRTVPRQETYQVPVRICVPTKKGDPGKKGGADFDAAGEVPNPFVDDPPEPALQPEPDDEPGRSA